MISGLVKWSASGIGRPTAVAATACAALGVAALVMAVASGLAAPALATLTASWLFFSGCAAGGLAFAAAIRLTGGRWAAAVLPLADASAGFFAPALALLLVIVAAADAFAPWIAEGGRADAGLVIRQVLASALLFAAGVHFLRRVQRGAERPRVATAAAGYLLLYAVVLSLWAFDLVVRLDEGPSITLLPAFYFLGAFLSGVAWVGLLTALRGAGTEDTRHDLGKLLFGLLIVWSYLLWAIFLPIWYGNQPEESATLLLRWRAPWKPVSVAVLVLVSAGPFWLLFAEPLKRRRATLAVGAGAVLLGLLAEAFLLVLPSLALRGGIPALALGSLIAAGVMGLFLLTVGARLGHRSAMVVPNGPAEGSRR
jgi:hypothetical protein